MPELTDSQKDFSIGMDLGVYAFCILMGKQAVPWEPKDFQKFADAVALNIENTTGMPAEDVALHLMPVLEKAMEGIKGI